MPFDSTRPPLTDDERTTLDNLRELERVLDETPDRDFDMGYWWRGSYDHGWTSCDTTGCLLGWAAQDSYFKDRGLCLRFYGRGYLVVLLDQSGKVVTQGYNAGARLLPAAGIMCSEYIFSPCRYEKVTPTKEDVREHIHEVYEQVLVKAAQRIAAQ